MENDKWEVGDIAICIKVGSIIPGYRKNPSLRLYGEYLVNAINVCSCGNVSLDVGLPSEGKHTRCSKCDNHYLGNGAHWCASARFVKKQTKEMVQMELNAAVEAENYELAQILKERLEAV